jgi:cold shock CspA family protein/ribosome-associated translation inhibitor RaiA
MTIAIQVAYKNVDSSPALTARIEELAGRLARFENDIQSCHVTVEVPHRHHQQGKLYDVHLRIAVPRGTIVVKQNGSENHAHEDPYVAVRDAFNVAVRQLEDHMRNLHGQVKRHEPVQLHGHVARFIADGDYGFIEMADGGEIYFHQNSVHNNGFKTLRIGDKVKFTVTEGDKGRQASTVHPLGNHATA